MDIGYRIILWFLDYINNVGLEKTEKIFSILGVIFSILGVIVLIIYTKKTAEIALSTENSRKDNFLPIIDIIIHGNNDLKKNFLVFEIRNLGKGYFFFKNLKINSENFNNFSLKNQHGQNTHIINQKLVYYLEIDDLPKGFPNGLIILEGVDIFYRDIILKLDIKNISGVIEIQNIKQNLPL